jgi:hypothetical protein
MFIRQPASIKIIANKPGIIDIQYKMKYDNLSMINTEVCKGLKYAIDETDEFIFQVNVKGIWDGDVFVSVDSYGNSTPSKAVAFEATWLADDIKKYNCDNYPDVWKHATIDNLSIQFKHLIRDACKKGGNYNKYFLCSKVM